MSYALGLDVSTQSLTAVAIDIGGGRVAMQRALSYASEPRLRGFGIDPQRPIIPPRVAGEADQPPLLFLKALTLLFDDMQADGFPLDRIAVINLSAQQHGHVYLGAGAGESFASLREGWVDGDDLPARFEQAFSYLTAPIWMTSNSRLQADQIREAVGGSARMVALSGSDSPARFTGAIIRRVGQQFPEVWQRTKRIHLLSSFMAGVLAGDAECPIDWGNASGMSLMDWEGRRWSPELLEAVAAGLPDAAEGLRRKLPALASPLQIVGTIAPYFVSRYGFAGHCQIVAGSGDNPQSKVLVSDHLLSLGSSFVIMIATDRLDRSGMTNAMYDGIGRAFIFGCRTNGSLVWDRVRADLDLDRAETLLRQAPIGERMLFWQPRPETFPQSPAIEPVGATGDPMLDWPAAVDTGLALLRHGSRPFMPEDDRPLYLTGGPAASEAIVRRVAAFWGRPVVTIGDAGAAMGAAVAGATALASEEPADYAATLSARLIPAQAHPAPSAAEVAAAEVAERLVVERFERLISEGIS